MTSVVITRSMGTGSSVTQPQQVEMLELPCAPNVGALFGSCLKNFRRRFSARRGMHIVILSVILVRQDSTSSQLLPRRERVWSVRITGDYRALGARRAATSDLIVWFWIGTHNDYDKLISQLKRSEPQA